jgi:GGDEF domain-containing protein
MDQERIAARLLRCRRVDLAERLREAVATLDLRVRGESLRLSISIGVAALGEHGSDSS